MAIVVTYDLDRLQVFIDQHSEVRCLNCNRPLSGSPVLSYDHPNGYEVKGKEKKQWIYVECKYCGYENSIRKLELFEIGKNNGLAKEYVRSVWTVKEV